MRRLRPLILDVELLSGVYAARSGVDDMPRAPARADVDWHTYAHTREVDALGGFAGEVSGEVHAGRATLPLDARGLVITDSVFDVGTNGHRIADTPPLRADALRGWLAIELHHLVPTGSSVTYRLHDGTTDLYWSGAAWLAATDPDAHWSTRAEVQANFAVYPPTGRRLTVRARLSSTDDQVRPSFFGYRVAYGIRQLGDEDDALIRVLLRTLRAELRSVGVARFTTAAGDGAGPFQLGPEVGYDVTGVLAVFDLTADPAEAIELPGTFAAGTPATWTPDTPIDDAHLVHLEFEYSPDVVISRHRDIVEIERTPALLIQPGTTAAQLNRGAELLVVRDLEVDPPTAVGLQAPAWLQQPLDLTLIAELGADVRRLQNDLRNVLQGSGYRSIVSEETGRIVDVRELTPLHTGGGRLLRGVQESTADWLIGYAVSSASDLEAVDLTRTDGVIAGLPTGA